jgi:peptidoglycan/xylan/chitin deacetylase (PgdA/CDA1 family)
MLNLCFHGVGTPERPLEPGEAAYWVDEATFRSVVALVGDRADVRLSFDDGNASDATLALPALLAAGLSAEFFVLAGRLDRTGSLSGAQVRELADAGMGIGSHGMHHRSWRSVDRAAAVEELEVARDRIAAASGRPVEVAACPMGQYDRTVLRRLRRAGFRRVMTSDRAHAHGGAWLQPRYSVRSHDTVDSVRALLDARPSWPASAHARARILAKAVR